MWKQLTDTNRIQIEYSVHVNVKLQVTS